MGKLMRNIFIINFNIKISLYAFNKLIKIIASDLLFVMNNLFNREKI